MVARILKRQAVTLVGLLGLALGLAALFLLTRSAQTPEDFDRLSGITLVLNVGGIGLLLMLLTGNLHRLIRDLREHNPGSRLKARMVTMFIVLAVLPMLLVYYFSVEFLNRGIDSWFDVRIETGLEDALELSRDVLDMQMTKDLAMTENVALDLFGLPERQLFRDLARHRSEIGASEMTVFSDNRRIVATSADPSFNGMPPPVETEILLQTKQGRPYVYFDPLNFEVRTAALINSSVTGEPDRLLRASFPVPPQLARRAAMVDETFTNYRQLKFLRDPLKRTLTLTLTVVLLVSLLSAIYGAFFFSRRLVAPIQQLVAGTRAVAAGDFDTRLPTPSRDDIGFLVSSFNDMTRRLAGAREQAAQSQALVESERQKLEVILARLSTGVVSLEPDFRIRTANQSASAILGVDMEAALGRSLFDVAEDSSLMQQFTDVAGVHLKAGESEWREQIVLSGEVGRRVLTCGCSALPADDDSGGGYVVVFDDITALLQAQRDSAWGEVARRLAHEIKNPLTPIQLSAERMRRKYLSRMPAEDAQVLDRATHTIVQQVEAMKDMVNAFSEYARAPDMDMGQLDINKLVREVADLYRTPGSPYALNLLLAADDPVLRADAGRMRQILHNLIRNAIEAIDAAEDGVVEIHTAVRTTSAPVMHYVDIDVQDNGPGFTGANVERVFDPYVTSKPKGTGLGLAIVKKLVEEHAGVISARNVESGGARLAIQLPMDEETREAMLALQPQHGSQRDADRRRDQA